MLYLCCTSLKIQKPKVAFELRNLLIISMLTAGSINPEANQHVFKREMLYLPEELKRGKFKFFKSVGLWAFIMIALYVLIYVNLW